MYLVLLINILLSQLNLEWDGDKLIYSFECDGKISHYEIETSFENVLKFLGINECEFHNITTMKGHYEVIKDCFIMNTKPFYKYSELLTNDHLEFITSFQLYALIRHKQKNPIPTGKDLDSYIDGYFNCNLTELRAKLLDHSICPLKDKFNGKLAMRWVDKLKPGKVLEETMIGFKESIVANHSITFNNFLLLNTHVGVRIEFLNYYYSLLCFDSFEDDLPF